MEWFDADYIPNGSDNSGRYTYAKQVTTIHTQTNTHVDEKR